jgi:hypothetical protein
VPARNQNPSHPVKFKILIKIYILCSILLFLFLGGGGGTMEEGYYVKSFSGALCNEGVTLYQHGSKLILHNAF